MKIYHNTTKRIAKKKIGKRWEKILYGATLKPGDLVSTCKGYNERIKEITPCWTGYKLGSGSYVYDFDIVTEVGSCCSLVSCCSFPLETREEIIQFWNYYNTDEGRIELNKPGNEPSKEYLSKIAHGLASGQQVFDDNGQICEEFCNEYEKVRFNREN